MKVESDFLDQFNPYFSRIDEELGDVFGSVLPLVKEVGTYSLFGGGKKLRPLFFILSSELCNYFESDKFSLSIIFECLHVASLLHDDVLDNASIRRGRPSANNIWGNSAAVLVGDFLFSRSSKMVIEKKQFEFLEIITDTATRMTEGQILELVSRHNWDITKAGYIDIITLKTALLISSACAGAASVAGAGQTEIEALKSFGLNAGIAFQIVDDIFDYTSTIEKVGKPIGNDLREGKITLPLIYALADVDQSERGRLMSLFKEEKASEKDYARIIELVRNDETISMCHKDAQDYVDLAEISLSPFPESPLKRHLLELNQFMIDRTY